MGVCISHRLGQTKPNVKDTLDQAEALAKVIGENTNVGIEVRRLSDAELLIDVEGCETLDFNFKTPAEIMSAEGWSYEAAVLTDDGKRTLDEGYEIKLYPQNEKMYAAAFCKTQYAGKSLAHKVVADLIKVVAGRCFYAEVCDEGDYYHTGKLGDAVAAIKENGIMIASIGAQLEGMGYEIKKGGETTL